MANPWMEPEYARAWAARMARGVPVRDLLLDVLCRLAVVGRPTRVLELGIGTGLATQRLSALLPDATFVGVDASRAMLDLARERLPAVQVVESDLRADWPSVVGDGFDLVVSANTIHHVEGDGKRDVYANAFRVLAPGGRFLNGERLAVEPELFEHYRALWQALHERIGMEPLPEDWTYERYCERLGEAGDVPELLQTQLAWLREIGFDPVTTFWKEADRSVFGGVRP